MAGMYVIVDRTMERRLLEIGDMHMTAALRRLEDDVQRTMREFGEAARDVVLPAMPRMSGGDLARLMDEAVNGSHLIADWTPLAPRPIGSNAGKVQAPIHLRAPMARGQRSGRG